MAQERLSILLVEQVNMSIDHPGQHGGVAEIDDRGAARDRQVRADRGDPIVFDQDHLVGRQGRRRSVEQPARANRGVVRSCGCGPGDRTAAEARTPISLMLEENRSLGGSSARGIDCELRS